MNFKLAISAIAACTLVTGAALAEGPKHKKNRATSGSVAAGVAAAGPNGAVAGGGAGSAASMPGMTRETRRSGHGSNAIVTTSTRCIPNSAATTSANTAYADRNTAAGASTTSGTAQGSGTVSSTSDGGAYAARSSSGATEADAYGTSTATARTSRHC